MQSDPKRRTWYTGIARGLHAAALRAEDTFDQWRRAVRRGLGRMRPAVVIPFRGYGTERALHVRGRVLEQRAYLHNPSPESVLRQLRFMYQRFLTDEVPGVPIRAEYDGVEVQTRTNEEGFFYLTLEPPEMLPPDRVWHEVQVQIVESGTRLPPVAAPVIVPPVEAQFAVVSDVDDTIIRTSANSIWKMVRTTLLSTPESRLPFRGVAAFYLALQRGPTGSGHNPLFYVSSSPWNLHDVLIRFMDVHGIPPGPLFLRDFGLNRDYLLAAGHRRHKRAQIEKLLETYPDLPFILIGDSGQRDPEIYAQVVRDFPGRVAAVYIRDVGLEIGKVRTLEFARLSAQQGVEMVLVADTEAAAIHAAEHGFIEGAALPDIRAEKAKDMEAAGDFTQLIRSVPGGRQVVDSL